MGKPNRCFRYAFAKTLANHDTVCAIPESGDKSRRSTALRHGTGARKCARFGRCDWEPGTSTPGGNDPSLHLGRTLAFRVSAVSSPFLVAIAFTLPVLLRGEEVLSLEASRPLQEAVTILERKYGWRIAYEDPPYTDARDLVDKTHPAYRGPGRAIDPRGGRVEIRYSVSPVTGKPDSPGGILQMLIDDHVRRGNPGAFQLRMFGDTYGVIPVQGSVLDSPITLPEKQRTYQETLEEIVRAVSRVTGIRVSGPGMYQPRFGRFTFAANSEPARSVLMRLFQTQKGYRFCWHLLYGANWGYALNTHGDRVPLEPQPPKRYVMKEVKLPDGSKAVIPVEVP